MTNRSLRTPSVRTVAAWLVSSAALVAACSNTGETPPSDDMDTGAAGTPGAAGASGKGGKSGVGGASSGGASAGGKASTAGTSSGGSPAGGSSAAGSPAGGSPAGGSSGGTAGTCPPSKFFGLPECAAPGKHPCLTCACNDLSSTLCSAKYGACKGDEGCAKTVECVLSGCPVSACEQFVGNSLQKLLDLEPCLQTTCKAECADLFGGSGGAGGAGGGSTSGGAAGSTSGGSGGAATVCAPNSFRCTGAKLEKCDAAGSGFSLSQDCGAMVCDASAGKCTAGGCGDGWTITYAITGGFTITETTLGAGDKSNLPIGTGELQIRFDDVGGAPGGTARLLSYKMPMKFEVTTSGLTVATDVVTSAAYADCGVAKGAFASGVLKWDSCKYGPTWNIDKNSWKPAPDAATGPGCVNGYSSVGNVKCTDKSLFAKCSDGNLKDGDNPQNSTWNQPLNSFEFSSDLKSVSMVKLDQPSPGGGGDKGVETPNTSPSRTWFTIKGSETGRVKAAKPCSCN